MSAIEIRQATKLDAEMLSDLCYQTFWDAFHEHPKNSPEDMADYMATAFSLEQIKTELADTQNIFLIAEIEGKAAGYAKLIIESREEPVKADKPIELSRLYSHQKFLGKGVGNKLIEESFAFAKKLFCDAMWLGVWEFNPRAQRFYEKYGFRVIGQHIFQLGKDAQTDIMMLKNLTNSEISD